ncbi:senescence-associated protein-domain-containing protein [Parasitella parasitica]|nr:senescence-associated protein-domain-containing protein [Parasitella parasitica]
MTVLPITPSADQIDFQSLARICLVDRVSVSLFDEGTLVHIDDGHLAAYITSDPNAEQQILMLRFYNDYDQEKAAIVLVSRSKAWLQDERTLIFPRAQGGLWRINCRYTCFLQDVLAYFIKYENRHQMKNTLAMIDPVSCQVSQVIADNVQLDRTESESILDEDDFISLHEDDRGQKLPVYIDELSPQETLDPSKVRKVKLLYQTGNAMVTGSDWIAHALVLAGQALAQGITSGGRMIEDKIEPNKSPIKLSEQERRVFEVAYNTTSKATNVAAGLVDMAVSTAVSKVNELVYSDQLMQSREPMQNASRHFGISALQAAVKIVGGVASAASMVLVSSRDSITHMIHKKYGADAGYMAEKTVGSGGNLAGMLVYFDARGISRRVLLGSAAEYGRQQSASQQALSDTSSSFNEGTNQVVFENNWFDDAESAVSDRQAASKNEISGSGSGSGRGSSDSSDSTKKTENIVITV